MPYQDLIDSLTLSLKGLFTVSNFLLFLVILALLLRKWNKKKSSYRLLIAALIIFLLCSTDYLPHFLAKKLESEYSPLNTDTLSKITGKTYIHLLGSGYGADDKLPATAQLPPVAQGRLLEAIRVFRLVDSSILVCSGGSVDYPVSQAAVVKKAAMLLGVDSSRVILLETPLTTEEEAKALKQRIGDNDRVIVVTDAMHMPRAVKFFTQQNINFIAAPTNYKAKDAKNDITVGWWPSFGNIILMDMILHEYLGSLKALF